MSIRRRTLLGAAAAAGVIGMAGCGRPPTQAALDLTADTVDDGPATGTLTVWAMGGEGENLPTLAERFMAENPDVDVQVTAVPWQSAHDKLANSIAAQATPDMAMIGTTWMAEFAAARGLRPVPEGLVDADRFFTGNVDTAQYLGGAWGVPWYTDTRILIYRADLAARAGVTAPTTWADYEDFNAALAETGVEFPTYLSAGGDGTTNMFLPFVWQSGGSVLDESETRFTIDTAPWERALTEYLSIFQRGDSPLEGRPSTYQSDFAAGTIGSFVSGPYELNSLNELLTDGGLDPAEALGVAPMPYSDQPASFTGGANLSVFQTSQNPDASWKLIRFLAETPQQRDWYDLTTDLPAVREAWEAGTLAEDDRFEPVRGSVETGVATPSVITWVQLDNMLNREIEKVTRGVNTVAQGLSEMQRKAELIGTGK